MPTIKQIKAAEALSEGIGSIGEAMREAGYSESTSKTPQRLTESDGWKELMAKHLDDTKLAKVHEEGLRAMNKDGVDFAVRHKYLDTAYKLKGSYAPEKHEALNVNVNMNLTPDKIDQINQIALDEE